MARCNEQNDEKETPRLVFCAKDCVCMVNLVACLGDLICRRGRELWSRCFEMEKGTLNSSGLIEMNVFSYIKSITMQTKNFAGSVRMAVSPASRWCLNRIMFHSSSRGLRSQPFRFQPALLSFYPFVSLSNPVLKGGSFSNWNFFF